MKGMKEILKKARELAKPFRVTDGDGFRLKGFDPGDTLDLKSEDKPRAKEALDPFIERTVEIQDCLGEIQDTVFTRAFINSLYAGWKGKLLDPDLVFILGKIYQLQFEIARERRKVLGKRWGPFSSEETMTLVKGVLARGQVNV